MSNEEEFSKAIDNLLVIALEELHAFTDRLDYTKPYECKQATHEFLAYLGQKYEQASQEVARLEYISMRGGVVDGFETKAYQGISDESYLGGVEYYCKNLFGEVQDEQL